MITTTKKVSASCLKHSLLFTALFASLLTSQQAFATDCIVFYEWATCEIYTGGNQVQHNDIAYKANWWTLGDAPDQYSNSFQQWSKLGSCDTDQPQPQVSLTSPLNGAVLAKNDSVVISGNASSTNGPVQQVVFLVADVEVFVDNSAPYTTNWTALLGNHVISARATDSTGASSLSSVNVSVLDVVDNKPPAVVLTSPTDSTQINEGVVVNLSANANDPDGSISNVDFYVDDIKVDSATGAPFEVNWTAIAGVHSFKAVATDNNQASTTSATVTVAISDGKPGGGCIGVPTYVPGSNYHANDEVQ
ncbi:MAG: Ig-like domain-containing protein, partial [Psychrosphaera sp.]|nr:Ig-like domain-containing protein [Psychrosphaera sp.]